MIAGPAAIAQALPAIHPEIHPAIHPEIHYDPPPATNRNTRTARPELVLAQAPADSGSETGETDSLGLIEGLEELRDRDYWRELCDVLSRSAQPRAAIAACDRALLLDTGNPEFWIERSRLLQRINHPAEAAVAASAALRRRDDSSAAWVQRCQAWFALGRDTDALADCQRAIELDRHWDDHTRRADAYNGLGQALLRLGRQGEAIAAFQAALTEDPRNPTANVNQCEAFIAAGEVRQALERCQLAIVAATTQDPDTDPSDAVAAWTAIAQAATAQGNLSAAVAAYDRALDLVPPSSEQTTALWQAQGILLIRLEQPQAAHTALSQALRTQPDASLTLVYQCEALNALDRPEAARTACDQALAGDGRWDRWGPAQAWTQLSVALARSGQVAEAIVASDRAVGFQPDYARAWNNRGVILWQQGDYRAAQLSLERAIALDETYAVAWANLARVFRSQTDYWRAFDAYRQALSYHPANAQLWLDYSATLWQTFQYSAALDAAQMAIQLAPEDFAGWYNQGRALAALHRPDLARQSYDRALSLTPENAPENAQVWAAQAIALDRLGDRPAAEQAYQEAITRDRTLANLTELVERFSPDSLTQHSLTQHSLTQQP